MPVNKSGNSTDHTVGAAAAGHDETDSSEESSGLVRQVTLPNQTPESVKSTEFGTALSDRSVPSLNDVAPDNHVIALQQDFRHALDQLNQTYSGLLLTQQIQLNQGLMGVPGLCCQSPAGQVIWVNAGGDNLSQQAQKQLYDHHSCFIQQSDLAVNALCQQLAQYQFQVRENVCQLARLGIQTQMPLPQLQQLLPAPVLQPQPIALNTFPGIYLPAPVVGFTNPWLPSGCSLSPVGGGLQGFPSFERHWLPGYAPQPVLPSIPGFYYLPQPPSPNHAFHSFMNPHTVWNQWLASEAYKEQLPDLYSGLYYPEYTTDKPRVSKSSANHQQPFAKSEMLDRKAGSVTEDAVRSSETVEQTQQAVVTQKEEQVTRLQKQLEAAGRKVADFVKQSDGTKNKKHNQQVLNLEKQLQQAKVEHQAEIEQLMQLQKEALAKKEDAISVLTQKLQGIEQKYASSEEAQTTIDALKQELEKVKGLHLNQLVELKQHHDHLLAAKNDEVVEIKAELKALKHQQREGTENKEEIADLTKKLAEVEVARKQLLIDKGNLQAAKDTSQQLEQQYEVNIKRKDETIRVIREELMCLQKALKEVKNKAGNQEELEQQITNLTRSLENEVEAKTALENTLEEAQQQNQNLKADLDYAVEEKQNLLEIQRSFEGELEHLRRLQKKSQYNVATMSHIVSNLQEQLKKSYSQKKRGDSASSIDTSELEQRYKQAKGRITALEQQIKILTIKSDKLQADVLRKNILEQEAEESRLALDNASAECQRLQAGYEKVEKEKSELLLAIQGLEGSVKELREKLSGKEQESEDDKVIIIQLRGQLYVGDKTLSNT